MGEFWFWRDRRGFCPQKIRAKRSSKKAVSKGGVERLPVFSPAHRCSQPQGSGTTENLVAVHQSPHTKSKALGSTTAVPKRKGGSRQPTPPLESGQVPVPSFGAKTGMLGGPRFLFGLSCLANSSFPWVGRTDRRRETGRNEGATEQDSSCSARELVSDFQAELRPEASNKTDRHTQHTKYDSTQTHPPKAELRREGRTMEWKLYERGDGHGREWKSKMPWMPTRTSLDGMDGLLFLSVSLCSSPLFALSLPLFFCLSLSLPSSPLCDSFSAHSSEARL